MSTLTLKWGTLNGWDFSDSPKGMELIRRYNEIGSCVSAMAQHDTPEQVELVCRMIEECSNPRGIYLDWDGEYVTKDKATEYVRTYRQRTPAKATGAP